MGDKTKIEWADAHGGPGVMIHKVGNGAAGRDLDGRTWDGMPG